MALQHGPNMGTEGQITGVLCYVSTLGDGDLWNLLNLMDLPSQSALVSLVLGSESFVARSSLEG